LGVGSARNVRRPFYISDVYHILNLQKYHVTINPAETRSHSVAAHSGT